MNAAWLRRPVCAYKQPVGKSIVFHALMALEKRGWNATAAGRTYERFALVAVREAKTLLDIFHKRIEIGSLTEYYLQLHQEQREDGIRTLCSALGWIRAIAQRVKAAFRETEPTVYTAILQDFGDNLRRCGDPFDTGTEVRPACAVLLAKDIARMITLLYKGHLGAFFVIDCLRNPYESVYLRNEFAGFFLLSLYEHKKERLERYLARARQRWGNKFSENVAKEIFEEADRRDSGGHIESAPDILYKQNVTSVLVQRELDRSHGRPSDSVVGLTMTSSAVERCVSSPCFRC